MSAEPGTVGPELKPRHVGVLGAIATVGAAEAVKAVVGLALIPARTALLGVDQYGQLALWVSVVAVTTSMTSWPVVGLTRFLPGSDGQYRQVVRAWAKPQLFCAVAAFLGFGVAAFVSGDWVWVVVGVYASTELWTAALTGIARSDLQFRSAARAAVAVSVVGGVAGVLLIVPFGPVGVVLGSVLGVVPATLILGPLVVRRWRSSAGTGHSRVTGFEPGSSKPFSSRVLVAFSAPLAVGNIAWAGTAYVDRLMLEHWVSLTDVGLYSFAYTTAALPSQLLATLFMGVAWNQAVAAEAAGGLRAGTKMLWHYKTLYLAVALPTGAALCLFAPQIVSLLAPVSYGGAAAFVAPIVVGSVFFGLIPFSNQGSMLSGRPRVQTFSACSALVVNVVLNFVLIPVYGVVGAAYATLVSYLVGFAVSVGLTRRVFAGRDVFVGHVWDTFRHGVVPALVAVPALAVGVVVVRFVVPSDGRVLPAVVAGLFTAAGLAGSLLWWRRCDARLSAASSS